MPFRQAYLIAAITIAAVLAAPAVAQDVQPTEAVKMRQGVMAAVKWQFAPIGGTVKGERPFDTDLLTRATNLAALAKVAPEGFILPSGPDAVPATKAKPVIWQEQKAFSELMVRFGTEAERLALAVQSRNPEQLKAQFLTVNQVCKDCHEKYRAE